MKEVRYVLKCSRCRTEYEGNAAGCECPKCYTWNIADPVGMEWVFIGAGHILASVDKD